MLTFRVCIADFLFLLPPGFEATLLDGMRTQLGLFVRFTPIILGKDRDPCDAVNIRQLTCNKCPSLHSTNPVEASFLHLVE
jgi:hypothetical protein